MSSMKNINDLLPKENFSFAKKFLRVLFIITSCLAWFFILYLVGHPVVQGWIDIVSGFIMILGVACLAIHITLKVSGYEIVKTTRQTNP